MKKPITVPPGETALYWMARNPPACEACGAMLGWSRDSTGAVTEKPCALCARKNEEDVP